MEEIIIKSEPKDERENYDNIMSVDIKVEEEDPFLQENTSEIEIDNLLNTDIKVEVFPFLQDNDSVEGMDGVLKENDINVEDLVGTEGKEKRKTSDIKGQPKVKLAKTKHKLDFNEKKVINREQPNGERESEFSCNESDIEVGEDSDDSDYIPSEVKKQAKRERKKKKHRRSPDSKRRRKTQQERLMATVLERSPPEIPQSLAYDENGYSKEVGARQTCKCLPYATNQHCRCRKKLCLKKASRWAIYSAAKTANAMAHLMHNQLYISCSELQKIQLKPTMPYHGWCRHPTFHGTIAKEVKRLKKANKTAILNSLYSTTCQSICRIDYFELIRNCSKDDDAARSVFEKHGILPTPGDVICPNKECNGSIMKLNKCGNRLEWHCWKRIKILRNKKKALHKICRKKLTHNTGPIFQHIKLPHSKVLMFMQEFMDKDFKIEKTARRCGISIGSACSIKHVLEEVCVDVCKSQGPIGGPNSTIEIDVTFCARKKEAAKNSRDHQVFKEMWLFFGKERYGIGSFIHPLIIERTQENELDSVIPYLSEEVLSIEKIEKYIRPGSIIMSNRLSSEEKLSGYPKDKSTVWRYKHYVVKNKIVRGDDPWIHISGVKKYWSDVKEYCKRPGLKMENIRKYIGRYLLINPCMKRCTTQAEYRQRRNYIAETALHRLLIAVGNYYNKEKYQT